MAANTGEVSNKADELQRKRIAFELAKKIRADRQLLLSKKFPDRFGRESKMRARTVRASSSGTTSSIATAASAS